MRVMMKVSVPVEQGNESLKSGLLPKTMLSFVEIHKPEAAFWGLDDGRRTAFFVLDLKDNSNLPMLCEPFFSNTHAKIDIIPVMSAADLKAGLEKLPK